MNARERARLHEAGHCIVGRLFGQEASGVVVFSAHDSHAGHYLPSPRDVDRMTRAEFDALVEGIAVADLAGAAALEVFGDPDPGRGAGSDREHALQAVRQLAPAAPEAELDRLYGRAVALCREHRAAIARLAETLAANHDRLAGPEVRVALDAALGGWPSPRFDPASETRVLVRARNLFDHAFAELGPDPSFPARFALMRRCEAAARGGPPLR